MQAKKMIDWKQITPAFAARAPEGSRGTTFESLPEDADAMVAFELAKFSNFGQN